MNQASNFAAIDILFDFGFQSDEKVRSNVLPGLSFDFGNFKLSASLVFSRYWDEVVLLTGVLATQRTLSEVSFEMPRKFESREQCAAWIVWHLDKLCRGEGFIPEKPAPWLELGRKNKDTLPWEQERRQRELRAELYRARPYCLAARKWMRLALNTMAEHLKKLKDEDIVEISFGNGVLKFQLGDEPVILAAEGESWTDTFSIAAGQLRNLPKRLRADPVVVGIWEAKLELDRVRYAGVSDEHQ